MQTSIENLVKFQALSLTVFIEYTVVTSTDNLGLRSLLDGNDSS
jgi:hypothetical protein